MNRKNNFLNKYYMAKGMGRVRKSGGSDSTNNTSGGFGGLSNFGFGVGAGVRCDASDDSFFCQLTKFTSIISQFIFLFSVLFIVYIGFRYFVMPMMSGSNKRR